MKKLKKGEKKKERRMNRIKIGNFSGKGSPMEVEGSVFDHQAAT